MSRINTASVGSNRAGPSQGRELVFDQRKRVVEYDDVVNKQREIIYKRRRKILEESGGPELSKRAGTELKMKLNL